jgi:imidazolonepropionase-like amidohydrolase
VVHKDIDAQAVNADLAGARAADTLITAGLLWDGTGSEAIRDGAVLVRKGTIAAVGDRQRVAAQAAPDARRYEFPDRFLMPGLIDCHVHLCFPGDGTLAHDFILGSSRERILLIAARNAQAALIHGVTTVRDTGSKGRLVIELRDAIDSGQIQGSRIVVSGPPLTSTAGHMWYLSAPELDGEADGVVQLEQRARAHWKAGVNFYKVVGNGGDTPRTFPLLPQYTREELAAVVRVAEEHGTHVTIHANHNETIRRAIEAGIHMLEHCTFLSGPGVVSFDPVLADAIARRDIVVSHTLQHSYWTIQDGRAAWSELDEAQRSYVDDRARVTEAQIENLGKLWSGGVRIVASTDAGWRKNRIGLDYPIALELSVQAGMSPAEALLSGTRDAARAIGIGGRAGTLEAGKYADLVVIDGDPTSNVSVLRNVAAVMKGGDWVTRRANVIASAASAEVFEQEVS